MTYRFIRVAVLCLLSTSCAKVRDFGCLIDGYSISAPSHVEIGISSPDGTYVLERYVFQVGSVPGHIVAFCQRRPGADAQPSPGEKPCSGYNVIDTQSGQVVRGIGKDEAAAILGKAGLPMPKLDYAADYFSQDWADGEKEDFCLTHSQPTPTDPRR